MDIVQTDVETHLWEGTLWRMIGARRRVISLWSAAELELSGSGRLPHSPSRTRSADRSIGARKEEKAKKGEVNVSHLLGSEDQSHVLSSPFHKHRPGRKEHGKIGVRGGGWVSVMP